MFQGLEIWESSLLHNMRHLQVEGHGNLFRDPQTNSIVNKNARAYEEYISKRKIKSEENQKIQNFEEELTNMKSDIDEIKTLLRELLNGSRKDWVRKPKQKFWVL